MTRAVTFEEGAYGLRAIVRAPWSDRILHLIREREVRELELNHAKGWAGDDLSFLKELPELEALQVIDFKIESIGPIHALKALRALQVSTYCKTEIAFSQFPRLEECSLEWRPKARSLFECTTLRRLFLNRYDGKDLSDLRQLRNLEWLAVLNAPIENLRGIERLGRLRYLRLANLRRLTSLRGIEELQLLEELDINTCRKVTSIGEVRRLLSLKRLFLNNGGNIDSLKPLRGLEELEAVVFYESTNIVDGDLSPLIGRRKTVAASFQNRRHYTHKKEEFQAENKQ
jgi:hypothetical protein